MKKWAYYNEIDRNAAQWIRNLITRGLIAPGEVDERSIEDVCPSEVRDFAQCHWFAGVAVWSYALRQAGWSDETPVWTGSCPCQPFSTAGKGAGADDERHLWPAWFHLIEQCGPNVIFGEQVEAAIKHSWLDLVQSDMEGIGYAVGATSVPAGGFGAPHIRQRLFFVGTKKLADTDAKRLAAGAICGFQNAEHHIESCSADGSGSVADSGCERRQQVSGGSHADEGAHGWQSNCDHVSSGDVEMRNRNMGHSISAGLEGHPGDGHDRDGPGRDDTTATGSASAPGCTNGFWRDADWLPFRDGKVRPVEPGTFPLAPGSASTMGRLRAYGNAICAPVAEEFIRAYMRCQP